MVPQNSVGTTGDILKFIDISIYLPLALQKPRWI